MGQRAPHLAALLVAAVALSGCVTGLKEPPALRLPASEFRQRIDTLCLVPVRTQIEFPGHEEKLAFIERDIGDRLRKAGYTVVASSETAAAMKQAATELGGFYDPHTGEQDPARAETVRLKVLAALHQQLGCDATVQPSLAVVSVPFISGRASWDGVSYPYGAMHQGWTTGLSLWLSIRDLDNQELYFTTGGIETLADLDVGFFGSEFKPVADDRILGDQVRIVQAVNVCLRPLLDPPPATGG